MTLLLDAAVPDIPPPTEAIVSVPLQGPDAANALAPIEPMIRELASDASIIEIVDQASLQAAADLLAEVKSASKQLDGLKAVFVTPLEAATKRAKNLFKPLSELLDVAEKRLKDVTKTYLDGEREKETQAASVREAVMSPTTSAPVYVAPPPKVAGVSMAMHWTYQVEDIRALARAIADGTVSESFLQLNSGAIQAAIRSGTRVIPGLRIFQESRVVSR